MARQVVNRDKLAEAQAAADAAVVAADAAMEAATLAAEKVAEISSGDDLMGGQIVNLEKPAKVQEADGGGKADGYRIIRNGPEDFSVEGFFSKDSSQNFNSARGFPSEVAARQWVYDQLGLSEDR
jgi:membrane protein involved in colicin uptake